MKIRILTLLLTFTLVFSLMPALAFAGNETDEEITLNTQEKVGDDDIRVYGTTRYDTAMAAAETFKGRERRTFDNAVVAYGKNFPDALAGGYLAKVKDAPILLVEPKVEDQIANYIKENMESGGTVYLLGGTGVVSSSFENKLKAKGIKTERLGGKDRYDTNLKILQAAGVTNQDILVCTGKDYADSLSASAAGLPILLVGKSLNDAQRTYLKSLGTSRFYLIGGNGAVKPEIESDLRGLGYGNIERIAGSTRYETSTAVAKKFRPTTGMVVLAYAKNFPDGLAGGPLAMKRSAPIILTDSNKTAAAKEYVKEAGGKWSITLGGPSLISDEAVKTIMGRNAEQSNDNTNNNSGTNDSDVNDNPGGNENPADTGNTGDNGNDDPVVNEDPVDTGDNGDTGDSETDPDAWYGVNNIGKVTSGSKMGLLQTETIKDYQGTRRTCRKYRDNDGIYWEVVNNNKTIVVNSIDVLRKYDCTIDGEWKNSSRTMLNYHGATFCKTALEQGSISSEGIYNVSMSAGDPNKFQVTWDSNVSITPLNTYYLNDSESITPWTAYYWTKNGKKIAKANQNPIETTQSGTTTTKSMRIDYKTTKMGDGIGIYNDKFNIYIKYDGKLIHTQTIDTTKNCIQDADSGMWIQPRRKIALEVAQAAIAEKGGSKGFVADMVAIGDYIYETYNYPLDDTIALTSSSQLKPNSYEERYGEILPFNCVGGAYVLETWAIYKYGEYGFDGTPGSHVTFNRNVYPSVGYDAQGHR